MPYETTITLRVLHQEPIPDDMTIGDIYREGIEGDYSMDYDQDTQAIDDATCKRRLEEQGTDISFFYPDEEDDDDLFD